MKLGTVIQMSLLLLLLVSTTMAQQRRPRQGLRNRPSLRRVPGRKPGSTRFLRGGGPPRRRPGKGFKPPPPAAPPVPGPDLVVPAGGAPSETLRAGLDGVRNFQHLLSDTPPAPGPATAATTTTPAPRPHSTTRPPLSREQVAMLQELQTILGGKPLPIDTTTPSSNSRLPDAKRQLPLFPPFGNGAVGDGEDGEGDLPGEGVVSGALFQDFSPSRLFLPPSPVIGGQRRQFVRFPDEPSDVASGVVEPGKVRFPRPATVAPSIVTARPTTAPSLRILGGLRPLLDANAENSERGARVIQSVDSDGQLVTSVLSSSTRATLDRAVTPPSFPDPSSDFGFGFGRPPLSPKPRQRPGPGPALATGLRLHHVLTSTSRPTQQPAVKATTYNPQALRNAILGALNANSAGQTSLPSGGAVRDLGRNPLSQDGGLNALTRDRFVARPAQEKADAEDIVRRSVMPQNPEKLCQSTAENGFCDTQDEYPKAYMERVVDQCSTILEYLFSEVPDDLTQLTAHPGGGRDSGSTSSSDALGRSTGREWSWASYNYQQQDVCDATAHFVEPSYARATDGRWYVVVQHRHLRQRVSISMCNQLEGFCRTVSDCGHKSRCVQTFYHRTLIAADPQLPTKCPRMRTFRLPGGCQCQVELAKSLRTLGQAANNS